ncbi:hypothetical protein [Ligilactobacillus murinus]|uniref:Uncharacterized protein n=1 Tax=Ligilactobacillus murinus TaxID=1622 RepID=A0A4Q2AWZ8_9LACO|nr:hypothetical protein [Ligilactobacillus murinus]NBH84662.1 hypothetical protein [Lachnospiraceae bacterium]MBX9013346.1 hypothetical protein [Ligilactobacillus murinus]MCR1896242.1 hypothetical protein [Ligilactobacillus murinus]NBH40248.1 hypothetical protein [Ligilactobacillus murinus]RII81456.1 hypothetical protein D1870_01245 [Ligilactobacillus murinus]
MTLPEPVKIIETPHHFWFGGVDLAYAVVGDTKVEKLGMIDGKEHYQVTKSFIVSSYEYSKYDDPYEEAFARITEKDEK